MDYSGALDFIYSRRKFQKSSGHERIKRLLQLMGDPQKYMRFVHVTGTNGKGSVSTALSFILRDAGYNTGLFTSPFVVSFCERVQVNGEFITEKAVARITSELKEKITLMEKEGLYPTVFEVTTALAMVYFYEMSCDVVVLEAGIGGGKDSTSVIDKPVLSVITSVSLDHCEVLGDTVTEITKEKCGIIKGGAPVVSYPFESGELPFTAQHSEAVCVIKDQCEKKGSKLFTADTEKVTLIKSDFEGNEFIYDGLHLKTKMCGGFQVGNILTACECARVLSKSGFIIEDSNIEKGIFDFFIAGRMECVSSEPAVILDGGHNEGAMLEISKMISSNKKGKTVGLCAFMKDKDYEKSLSIIAPCFDEMVFTCADALRGEEASKLREKALPYCKNIHCESDEAVAFQKAKDLAGKDGTVFVCGSFYLTSDIRKYLI